MNIIKSEANLLFVDWANSGMGSPFCDLAEVAVFLEPEKHVDLMKQYRNNKIERHDHELLTLHWRMRLGLFAAWALEEAAYRMKEPISRIDYPASKDHYLTLLKNILNGRETLSTGQDFLLFSSAMLSAVIASNIDDHWK